MKRFFVIQIDDENFVRIIPAEREFMGLSQPNSKGVGYFHAADADSVLAGWADIDRQGLVDRLQRWFIKETHLRDSKEEPCTQE